MDNEKRVKEAIQKRVKTRRYNGKYKEREKTQTERPSIVRRATFVPNLLLFFDTSLYITFKISCKCVFTL